MTSPNLSPHIRSLYIYTTHTYYNPQKDRISQSKPILHYPSKETLTHDDERLIGLSEALCGFVREQYVSVSEDQEGSEHEEGFEDASQMQHGNGAHNGSSGNSGTPEWTHGTCHTLMNQNTQWIFKPFECTHHRIPAQHRAEPLQYLSTQFPTARTILSTNLLICFILQKESPQHNYKSEFDTLIDSIFSTLRIFYIPHRFNILSWKSQYPIVNQFIMEYIHASSTSLLTQGISFLPIDAYLFVRIQAFIHRVIEQFSYALYPQTVFLFQKYMLFSSLDHHEARTISTHVGKLYSSHVQKPHNHFLFRTGPLAVDLGNDYGGMQRPPFFTKMPQVNVHSVRHSRAGRDVMSDGTMANGEEIIDSGASSTTNTTPSDPQPNTISSTESQNSTTNESQFTPQHLLVVDYNNIQIHWFVREGYQDDEKMLLKLQQYAQPYVDKLNILIGEKMSAIHTFDEHYKYLYYNHMNLAVRSSLLQRSHASQLAVYQHYIQILRNQFMAKNNHGLKEIYFKAKKDLWIFGRYFGQREFYIIYDQKLLSLTEFAHEVEQILSVFFSSPTVTAKE